MTRRKKSRNTFYRMPYDSTAASGTQFRFLQEEGAKLPAELCPEAFRLAAAAENQARHLFGDQPLPPAELDALKRTRLAFGLAPLPDPLAPPYTTGRVG